MTAAIDRWVDEIVSASREADRDLTKPARVLESFRIRTARELADYADTLGDPGFLVDQVWPADAYGMLGASFKAGKTFAVLDLAVAVATGGRWLGWRRCTRPGPVLLFAGEGGARKLNRRGRAVADFYGHEWTDLPVHVAERVPQLTDWAHVDALEMAVDNIRPVCVIIDPVYLAARGVKTSSLVEVGEALEAAQRVCQDAAAALVVVHHWNKGGTGSGAERMSGAGWAEWGRVLVQLDVKQTGVDPSARSVTLIEVEAIGDELPPTKYAFRRTVGVDDPSSLISPMRYKVAAADPADAERATDRATEATVLEFVRANPGANTTAIRSNVGGKSASVGAALARLVSRGAIRVVEGRRGAHEHYAEPTRGVDPAS